jgi:predicted Fe-Mo cluster-binding NifX family protein
MKIAVPLFRNRVSPYFGASSKFLVVETEGKSIRQVSKLDIVDETPMAISTHLIRLGVEKIICGGIQSFYKDWLIKKGVNVVDNQKGIAIKIVKESLGNG